MAEDLSQKSLVELAELARDTDSKELMRAIADQVGVAYSGNTGIETLRPKVLAELIIDENPDSTDETPPEDEPEDEVTKDSNDPVMAALAQHREEPEIDKTNIYVEEDKGTKLAKNFTVAEMLEMDAAKIKDDVLRKNVIRTQALRMRRVKINNLDPADAEVPGAIITCYSRYTGKVSKYVPYDEDQHPNGYHVQQIILDDLLSRTFNLRKEKKTAGSSFGVKQYKTTRVKKFAIEILPDLSPEELKELAEHQRASGAIDRN
jgi:hypothetical protein